MGHTKYMIISRKKYTDINITIPKTTERIKYNIIFEVTDDKRLTHLLINIVIVVWYILPFLNISHP